VLLFTVGQHLLGCCCCVGRPTARVAARRTLPGIVQSLGLRLWSAFTAAALRIIVGKLGELTRALACRRQGGPGGQQLRKVDITEPRVSQRLALAAGIP
jgi:hypothetical protein